MSEVSDECYAVSNAVDELKALATGIIGSNENDGVAKWLQQRFSQIEWLSEQSMLQIANLNRPSREDSAALSLALSAKLKGSKEDGGKRWCRFQAMVVP